MYHNTCTELSLLETLEILHYRQPENSRPPIEMIQIKRYRPEIQPSTAEAFPSTVKRQESVQLSFKNNQADEIVDIEETTV